MYVGLVHGLVHVPRPRVSQAVTQLTIDPWLPDVTPH